MANLKFSQPVKVWTRPGRARHVYDLEQAAAVMLNDWPQEWQRAASLRRAKKACLAAYEGSSSADAARAAFEKAAREAKLLDIGS